jgi:hypothetical protein
LFLPQNFLSRPAAGVCFVFELCHKMSLGQAEGVIRAILMILNRFSSDLGAFGTCFADFRFNFGDTLGHGRGILALAGQ